MQGSSYVFPDGVIYTRRESFALCKASPDTLRAVHTVKKIFGGELIYPSPRLCFHSEDYYSSLQCCCGSRRFHLLRSGSMADIYCRTCSQKVESMNLGMAQRMASLHPAYCWQTDPQTKQETLF